MSLAPLLPLRFETTAGPKTLAEMIAGPQPTVFVAYPMDFTAVCTKQLCSYRDGWAELSRLPCRWWGINQSSAARHEQFKARYSLPMELVTDPDGRLLSALGLKWLLGVKRGFAVVSPQGELLGKTTIFPFFYQKPEEVKAFLAPILGAA